MFSKPTLTINKIIHWLLLLFLFLLPWHTRYMYDWAYLNGGFWEYGSGSLFATEILLWIIIVLFFADLVKNRRFNAEWRKNKKGLFLCATAFLFLIAHIVFGSNPKISFQFVFRLLEGAALMVIIARSVSPTRTLLLALWSGGVVQGVLALWQFFNQEIIANKWLGLAHHSAKQLGDFVVEFGDERWLRAYGSFGSPNMLGGFLAVCWVIGLLLYLSHCRGVLSRHSGTPSIGGSEGAGIYAPSSDRNKMDKSTDNEGVQQYAPTRRRLPILITIGQLIIFSGLILSFSRGAWIAAASGVIVLLSILYRARAPLQSIGRQLVFSFLLFTFYSLLLTPLFTTRLSTTPRLEAKSIAERQNQYREASQIITRNPSTFLFGVGPGKYTYALWRQDKWRPVWQYQPVHNVYMLMIAEVGVVGFTIVFLFSCFLVRKIWRTNPLYLSVIVAILISGLFDHFWWSLYGGQMIWWGVLAVSLSHSPID
ncbi:MAG TPA: O-antigen ligase family protein [Patescibacteria group bacterium]|nr:O-antigen ligase family protein [Patescibacteria group bacterium]